MFAQVDYIMVVVSDMTRSIEFYRDKLGLTLKFASPQWTEFQTGATTLALHGGGRTREQTQEEDFRANYAGTCSIGFSVDKLDRVYEDLQSSAVCHATP